MPDDQTIPSPGFFRLSAVVFYDALLLLAILFFATALALPLNKGEAFTNSNTLYPAYLLGISFLYYGWFWTHSGQTPGLKTWKLRALDFDQHPITWKQAFFRFFFGLLSWVLFGAGFLWILIDKEKLSLHDHLSNTRLYPVIYGNAESIKTP
jgi:uncharacterized RDD family membrane protein YckC